MPRQEGNTNGASVVRNIAVPVPSSAPRRPIPAVSVPPSSEPNGIPIHALALNAPRTLACSRARTRSYMTAPMTGFSAPPARPPSAATIITGGSAEAKASAKNTGQPPSRKQTAYVRYLGSR